MKSLSVFFLDSFSFSAVKGENTRLVEGKQELAYACECTGCTIDVPNVKCWDVHVCAYMCVHVPRTYGGARFTSDPG